MASASSSQPSLSDLVFPSASEQPNLSHLLTDLKRTNLSISNRLHSILKDAEFVRDVARVLGGGGGGGGLGATELSTATQEEESQGQKKSPHLPRRLVTNERCGSWYVRPREKGASAYFKSTDGHASAWKFSTRRLNLHLLDVIGKSDGCIVVDSTRRGKRMPDALSKTIPIWCAVLNRALFPSLAPDPYHALYAPPQVVSPSEHAQIEALLPTFLSSFQSLHLDLPSLRQKIHKPLRPFWVTPDTELGSLASDADGYYDHNGTPTPTPIANSNPMIFEDFHPVICCTASRRVPGGEITTIDSGMAGLSLSPAQRHSFAYVQGAGDDTENWAHGLTAPLWWAHADKLLSTPDADLPELVRSLVQSDNLGRDISGQDGQPEMPKLIGRGLAVCSLPVLQQKTCETTSSSGSEPGVSLQLQEQGRDDNEGSGVAIAKEEEGTKDNRRESPRDKDISKHHGNTCKIFLLPTTTTTVLSSPTDSLHLQIPLGRHKTASRNLRTALPSICAFASRFAAARLDADGRLRDDARIIVACESGRDVSVAAALAICVWCFDGEQRYRYRYRDGEKKEGSEEGSTRKEIPPIFNKDMVRVRLGAIMMAFPEANPGRASLQSVNSFLMDYKR